jgi:hypothetical protein
MQPIRLRQVALVARRLQPIEAEIATTLGLAVGHRDPSVGKFGLENAILPVGRQFLEVVAPTREGTAASRYLDRRGGDGGYMVICQCEDQDSLRRRLDDLGVRVVLSSYYGTYRSLQMHPADTGGSFLEIDWHVGWDDPDAEWWPAGENWRKAVRTDVVGAIAAVEIQAADVGKAAVRWSAITELDVRADTDGNPSLAFENATIRFVPVLDGRGDGLGGVDLVATDPGRAGEELVVGGLRVRLV